MNQAEVLCHSSGPWKKHKYFKKIGEGANAVYKYAKDTAGKVTGDYYDKEANKYKRDAEFYNHEANRHFDLAVKDAGKERTDEEEAAYNEYWKAHQNMMDANFYRQNAAEKAERDARYKADHSIGEMITGERSKARMEKYAKGEYKNDDARYRDEKKKYDKTFAGKVEKGQAIIDRILNPPVKRTITDTKTGQTRTPSAPKSKADTVTLKRR